MARKKSSASSCVAKPKIADLLTASLDPMQRLERCLKRLSVKFVPTRKMKKHADRRNVSEVEGPVFRTDDWKRDFALPNKHFQYF